MDLEIDTDPPSKLEIQKAIKSLKNKKAPMAQNYRSINLSLLFFSRDHFSRCGSLNRNMRREVKLVLNGSVLRYTIITGHVFSNLWSILLHNIKAKNKITERFIDL
jgi:hypothetical protein